MAYETIPARYDNVRISFNFCETTFVYAEMTVAEGASVDFNNHSMFKPGYPVTIYAAMSHIKEGSDLSIDGLLPEGTIIEIYLRNMGGNGSFTITSSEEIMYQESIRDISFQTEEVFSALYPFAVSEKMISVTLDKDSEAVSLACSGGWVDLCGINVILPEQYAVERWYMRSGYDAYLSGEQAGIFLEKTSTVMICPNSYDVGRHITIQEDISYISETIYEQANAETIDAWGSAISDFAPSCLVRFERGGFSLGTTRASLLGYYEDVLSMMDRYSFDWYSNDYDDMLSGSGLADANTVVYGAYRNFNMELLELFQKHQ